MTWPPKRDSKVDASDHASYRRNPTVSLETCPRYILKDLGLIHCEFFHGVPTPIKHCAVKFIIFHQFSLPALSLNWLDEQNDTAT